MARMLGSVDLDFLEAILETLPDCPFFAKNGELRYVAANGSMARLCGVRGPSEMIGRMAGDFFPAHLAQEYEQLDMGVLATGAAITDRLHVTSSRRHRHAVLLSTRSPICDAEGRPVGICGTAQWLPDSPQMRRLTLVVDHLREGLGRPLHLNHLADLAGVSPSQLERDFKKVFRMSLRDFQHKLRLGQALQLLRGSSASIAEIAQICGYADQSAFTRRFRSLIGISPGLYRRGESAGAPMEKPRKTSG